jgi:hypothetical protein
MTAEPIRVDVELELLDPILRRAAVVVPRDEIGGGAAAIQTMKRTLSPPP